MKHPDGKFADWRLFVINDKVIASMTREGASWINNVANGATCKPFRPSDEMVKGYTEIMSAFQAKAAEEQKAQAKIAGKAC